MRGFSHSEDSPAVVPLSVFLFVFCKDAGIWGSREDCFCTKKKKTLHQGWEGCTFTFSIDWAKLSKHLRVGPDVNTPSGLCRSNLLYLCVSVRQEWQTDSEASYRSLCVFVCIILSLKRTPPCWSVALQATITFSSTPSVAACPRSRFLLAHKKPTVPSLS